MGSDSLRLYPFSCPSETGEQKKKGDPTTGEGKKGSMWRPGRFKLTDPYQSQSMTEIFRICLESHLQIKGGIWCEKYPFLL